MKLGHSWLVVIVVAVVVWEWWLLVVFKEHAKSVKWKALQFQVEEVKVLEQIWHTK